MPNSKLFTIAGTSVLNGELTYRFATGKMGVRINKLKKTGHSDIALQELPNPMTKVDAVAFLLSTGVEAVLPKGRTKAVKPVSETVPTTDETTDTVPATVPEKMSFGQRMAAAKAAKKAAEALMQATAEPATVEG